MAEQEEEKSSGSFGQIFVAVVLFNIISRVLEVWFIEAISIGLALFAVALIEYPFISNRKEGFLKWALSSLLFSVGYTGFIYGVSYLLCARIGAPLTWGLMGFGVFMSFRFVPEFFFKQKAKDKLWKWLAVSIGIGLVLAFFANIKPESFCKR